MPRCVIRCDPWCHGEVRNAQVLPLRLPFFLLPDREYGGRNAHGVSDHTQTHWNGIVGELSLTATPPVWLGPMTEGDT